MNFHIGPFLYVVSVATGRLFRGDREIMGEAVWCDKRILISGSMAVQNREEVLFHELVEAFEFHFPKPSDPEKLRDWDASVQASIRRDYDQQVGGETLRAMRADSPEPVIPAGDEARLRDYRFPELSDEQFALAKSLWESRGLDPWGEQFHVKIFHDPRRGAPSIRLVLNIEGIRRRAHQSKQYAGIDEIQFELSDEGTLPIKAIACVYRLVGGERQPFFGEARWGDFYGWDESKWDDVVRQHPHGCLARCAEAVALRRAFTEEVRDLFAREEMLGTQHRRAAKPLPESKPITNMDDDGEKPPATAQGLHLRLHELGYTTEAARRELIAQCNDSFGTRDEDDDAAFFRSVLSAAKETAMAR